MTTSQTSRTVRSYPFGPPDRLELDPRYAWLRTNEPVSRVQMPYGEEAWLATRYADVRTVLGDARFSRAAVADRDEPRVAPHSQQTGMLAMDPPEHSRLRRLVAKAFTVRRVEDLRPRAEQVAEELVDRMVEAGPPADLVDDFAVPLPVIVICELLGVPPADRDRFHVWSEAIVSTTSLSPQQIGGYLDNLGAYIAGLVEQRRREPTDADLLGSLVRARDEDDRLSEEEMVALAGGLLAAGHETTASQIPNFVYALRTHPDVLEFLRVRPDLVPAAVEELMRWVPLGAAAAFPRYAKEDIELSGVTVPAGDPVLAAVHSANRDGEMFPDPDRIDVTRSPNPHLGFGHGAHHCLGAPLARVELQTALAVLLRRLPELRFAVPEGEIPWKTGLFVRGPKHLPVTW